MANIAFYQMIAKNEKGERVWDGVVLGYEVDEPKADSGKALNIFGVVYSMDSVFNAITAEHGNVKFDWNKVSSFQDGNIENPVEKIPEESTETPLIELKEIN